MDPKDHEAISQWLASDEFLNLLARVIPDLDEGDHGSRGYQTRLRTAIADGFVETVKPRMAEEVAAL